VSVEYDIASWRSQLPETLDRILDYLLPHSSSPLADAFTVVNDYSPGRALSALASLAHKFGTEVPEPMFRAAEKTVASSSLEQPWVLAHIRHYSDQHYH